MKKTEKLWDVTIIVDGTVAVPARTAEEAVAKLKLAAGPSKTEFPMLMKVFPTFDVNGIDVEHVEELTDPAAARRVRKALGRPRFRRGLVDFLTRKMAQALGKTGLWSKERVRRS